MCKYFPLKRRVIRIFLYLHLAYFVMSGLDPVKGIESNANTVSGPPVKTCLLLSRLQCYFKGPISEINRRENLKCYEIYDVRWPILTIQWKLFGTTRIIQHAKVQFYLDLVKLRPRLVSIIIIRYWYCFTANTTTHPCCYDLIYVVTQRPRNS